MRWYWRDQVNTPIRHNTCQYCQQLGRQSHATSHCHYPLAASHQRHCVTNWAATTLVATVMHWGHSQLVYLPFFGLLRSYPIWKKVRQFSHRIDAKVWGGRNESCSVLHTVSYGRRCDTSSVCLSVCPRTASQTSHCATIGSCCLSFQSRHTLAYRRSHSAAQS